jgi:hypothetical protein
MAALVRTVKPWLPVQIIPLDDVAPHLISKFVRKAPLLALARAPALRQ